MSFIVIFVLIGLLIGFIFGGWLVEVVFWYWVFLINLLIGVIGFIVVMKIMFDYYVEYCICFDLFGYFMFVFGMVVLLFVLDGIFGMGMLYVLVMLMMVVGLVVLVGYWLYVVNFIVLLFLLVLFYVFSYCIGIFGNLFLCIGSSVMLLLIFLFLQVGMGMSLMNVGLLMILVVVVGMVFKCYVVKLVEWFGYWCVLMVNIVLVGLVMVSFIVMIFGQLMWLCVVQLVVFGVVNLLQFIVMNIVILCDFDCEFVSFGNSLLLMVMMFVIGFGVVVVGSLLVVFGYFDVVYGVIVVLYVIFVCVGVIMLIFMLIFWQFFDMCFLLCDVEEVVEQCFLYGWWLGFQCVGDCGDQQIVGYWFVQEVFEFGLVYLCFDCWIGVCGYCDDWYFVVLIVELFGQFDVVQFGQIQIQQCYVEGGIYYFVQGGQCVCGMDYFVVVCIE